MDATINKNSVIHLDIDNRKHKSYIKNLSIEHKEVLKSWLLGNFMHGKSSSGANQKMIKLLYLINNAPRSNTAITLYRATTRLLFDDAGINSQNPYLEYTEPKSWTVNEYAANTFADYIKEKPENKIVLKLDIPPHFKGFLFIGCPPDVTLCSERKMIDVYTQLDIPHRRITDWIIPEYEILLKPVKLYIKNYNNPSYTTIFSEHGIQTSVKVYNVTLLREENPQKVSHSYYPKKQVSHSYYPKKQVSHSFYSQNYPNQALGPVIKVTNENASELKTNTLMSNVGTGISKLSKKFGFGGKRKSKRRRSTKKRKPTKRR